MEDQTATLAKEPMPFNTRREFDSNYNIYRVFDGETNEEIGWEEDDARTSWWGVYPLRFATKGEFERTMAEAEARTVVDDTEAQPEPATDSAEPVPAFDENNPPADGDKSAAAYEYSCEHFPDAVTVNSYLVNMPVSMRDVDRSGWSFQIETTAERDGVEGYIVEDGKRIFVVNNRWEVCRPYVDDITASDLVDKAKEDVAEVTGFNIESVEEVNETPAADEPEPRPANPLDGVLNLVMAMHGGQSIPAAALTPADRVIAHMIGSIAQRNVCGIQFQCDDGTSMAWHKGADTRHTSPLEED